MRKILPLTLLWISIGLSGLKSQVVTFMTPSFETCGDPAICVPIIVDDFTDIFAFSYTMEWDEAIYEFNSLSDFNPLVNSFGIGEFNVTSGFVDNGFFTNAWATGLSGQGETLNSGDTLYRACFNVIGSPGDASPFEFTGFATSIGAVNSNGIIPLVPVNGTVTIGDTQPPTIACPPNFTTNTSGASVTINNGLAPLSMTDGCTELANLDLSYSTTGATMLSGTGNINNQNFNAAPNNGVTTVTYTLEDEAGLTSSCSFSVTVVQQAGDLTFEATKDTAFCNDNSIAIEIDVENFTNITSFSYTFEWDPTVFDFNSVGNFNLSDLDVNLFGLMNTGSGYFTLSWTDPTLAGQNVPDGDSIFTIFFDVVGNPGDVSSMSFANSPTQVIATESPFTQIVVDTLDGLGAIIDNPPLISGCPSNISKNTDAGVCTAEADWVTPTVSDDCDVPAPSLNQVLGTPSGSNFPLGSTTVRFVATDSKMQSDTCTFTVMVTDAEAPTAVCPATIADVQLDGSGNGTLAADIGDNSSTDNCGVQSETSPVVNFTCADLGVQTVVLTATDGSGNTDTETCSFNVVDNVDPVAVCPAAIADVVLDGSGNGTLAANIGGNNSTDNCSVQSETSPLMSFTCADVGVQAVVLTVTDGAGNTGTGSCTFNVVENEAPVAVCPATIADVQLDGSGNGTLVADIGDNSSTDNCGVQSETSPVVNFTCADLGVQTVVLTATDGSGNTDTETCSFNVVDNEAPVAVCPAAIADVVLDGSGNGTLAANIGDISSTDNCLLSSETSPLMSFTCADIGVQTVVLTATDGSGNTDTETCSFNVVENEAPVAVCPAIIIDVVLDGNGTGTLAADIGDNSSTDNCSVQSETSPAMSFTCADVGVQSVVLTATDGSGNTGTATCTFNVVDNSAPVAICPTSIAPVVLDGSGNGTLPANIGDGSSVDNCTVSSETSPSLSYGCMDIGTQSVVLTATDNAGNTDTETCSFMVVDNSAPSIVCPANEMVAINADCEVVLADYTNATVNLTDNCTDSTAIELTMTQSPLAGTIISVDTVITLKISDASGNLDSCSFNIVLDDAIAPAANCFQDTTVYVDAMGVANIDVAYLDSLSSDNCTVQGLSIDKTTFDCSDLGSNTVTLTVTDGSGNTSTCTTTIILVDNIAPMLIECAADTMLFGDTLCQAVLPDFTTKVVFADNCTNVGDLKITQIPPDGTVLANDTIVAVVALDSVGLLSDTCFIQVEVKDTTLPIITCPANINVNTAMDSCGAIVDYQPIGMDACGIDSIYSLPPSGTFFPTGSTTVMSTVIDTDGNLDSCEFVVAVNDAQNPFIECRGDTLITVVTAVTDTTVFNIALDSLSDNCGIDTSYYHLTGATTDDGTGTDASGESFNMGETTVTYYTTDNSGNIDSCSFNVTVELFQQIEIECPNDTTQVAAASECSATLNIAPPVITSSAALDTVYYTLNDGTSTSSGPDSLPDDQAFNVGETLVTYTAISVLDDTVTCSFTVTITDNETPVVTCSTPTITVDNTTDSCGAFFAANMQLATATDNCPNVQLTYNFDATDLLPVGSNMVIATATDQAGNTVTCDYEVVVRDTQPPVVVNCPANITVDNDTLECGAAVSWTMPTAEDNCGVLILESTPYEPGDIIGVGTEFITYTASDAVGNVTECVFSVTVRDTEAPTLTNCPTSDIVMDSEAGNCEAVVSWPFIQPSDNCNVVSYVISHQSGASFPVGSTTVQAVATDAASNTTICSFQVIVEDNEFPTMNNFPNDTLVYTSVGECGAIVSWGAIEINDNCGVDSFSCSAASGTMFPVGTTEVECTLVDVNGNIVIDDFTVVVVDNEDPVVDCPANVVVNTDGTVVTDPSGFIASAVPVKCDSVELTYNALDATDNCVIVVSNQSGGPVSGSILDSGTYDLVFVTEDMNTNSVECNFSIQVEAIEAVTATASNNSPCEGEDVVFSAQVYAGATYEWFDPMGNQISTDPSFTQPAIQVGMSGTFTVSIKLPYDCTLTADVSVNVSPNPILGITHNDLLCASAGTSLVLEALDNANTGITNYVWSTPQGATFFGNPINISSPTQGNYSLVATSANGCTATASVFIEMSSQPATPDLSGPLSACVGDTISLDGEEFAGAGIQYHWTSDPPGAITDVDNHDNKTALTAPGTYRFYYHVEQGGCVSDSAEWVVTVEDYPSFEMAVLGETDCVDGTTDVVIVDTTDAAGLTWTISGACTPTQVDSMFTFENVDSDCSGTYTITAASNIGCSSTETITLDITDKPVLPTLQATSDTICMGGTTTLFLTNVPLGANTLCYENGTLTACAIGSPIAPVETTEYGVQYTVDGCFSDTAFVTIYVEEPLSVPINVIGEVTCVNGEESVTLSTSAMGVTYVWDGPCGVQVGNGLEIPNITSACSGLYSVSVTGALGQCISIGTQQLEVTDMLDQISIVQNNVACDGGDVSLCAEPNILGATYTWTDPFGNMISTEQCPSIVAMPASTPYSVTANLNGCTSTDELVVDVLTPPDANDETVVGIVNADQSFNVVTNDSLATDDYSISVIQQPANGSVSYNGEGVFTYTPTEDFRETDVMAYEICYDECPDLCDIAIVTILVRYPVDQCIATTVITPNDDGINDEFVVSCLELGGCPKNQLFIFNQWGDQVFEAAPYDNTWRGTYEDKDLPDGTYYYIFKCDESAKGEKGFITIHR